MNVSFSGDTLKHEVISNQNEAITNLLSEQRTLIKNIFKTNSISEKYSKTFPIQEEANLIKLESELDEENLEEIVAYLKKFIGSGGIQKNISTIFSPNLIMQYNVDGNHNKKRLLNFKKLLDVLFTIFTVIQRIKVEVPNMRPLAACTISPLQHNNHNTTSMWNSNSQRWLVINKERLQEHASASTKTTRLCPNLYFYSKKKCRTLKATKLSNTVASQQYSSPSIKTKTRTRTLALEKGAPFGVKPCPNQIIVVILNVLLANCLISSVANMPTAGAAFGAELIEDDDRFDLFGVASLSANYRNRHSNLLHHEDYQQNLNLNNNNNNNNNNNFYGDQKTANQLPRSQNFKISPKPCSIGRIEGTCMFVWECIKSEGRHVGMCVDSFMFGSCCSHNASDNIVQSETFSYTRPTKPVGMSSVNHRPRPPHYPQRPSISGMTTIERPHGAGTLVIRPSGPHHQGVLFKPQPNKTKPTYSQQQTTQAATTKNPNSAVSFDMQSAASIPATNMWHTSPQTTHQHHWQLPTEPNFITKPRPPSWEKPTSMRPKPSKPTKKPIIHHDHTVQQQQPPPLTVAAQSTGKPATTTTKPKPQVFSTKPMKTTTTTRPYFRPTAGWPNSESTLSSTFSTTSGNYTSSAFSSSSSTTQLYTKPPASSVTHPQQQHHSITTRPPALPGASTSTTASSSSSSASTTLSSSSTPTATSTASMQHQHHHHQHQHHHQQTPSTLNLSTMESNEIVESSSSDSKLATIKTITAARSECGIPVLQRPETRIVGGKSAPFGRWPWQVSVRRTSFFGFSSTHRCGGALINENWIATAGHCVDDLLISQIRIRVGEYDFSHVQEQLPYIERGVSKKVVHPKYNFFTYEYDLALVKLEQPLEFAPHVSPICLPQTDSLLIGMNATVTGWGRLSEGGTLPSVLQEVSVPIVSNDNCKTMFLRAGRQEFIPDIFLCAGYETGGQDSCQGDSGGPLQVKSQDGRFFLAGIISWGIGCAEANLPGVCTRISKFVPWIMENVT